jgi:DNA-binding NtrC family response regulator
MPDSEPVTVLLVEANPVQREMIRAALTDLGYRVTASASGLEAMELYQRAPHDVVLVDVVLPDIPGAEVLCRARQVNPDQCVIMLTAEGDGLSAVGAIRADDAAVLRRATEPSRRDGDGSEMEAIISRSLERRRLARENRELQAKLVEASRVNAVISLAAAAAHDMNQPLTVMSGITELLLMDADPEDPSYQDLETLHRATQRLCDIVGKLSAVTARRSRPHVGDVETVDLERSAGAHAAG